MNRKRISAGRGRAIVENTVILLTELLDKLIKLLHLGFIVILTVSGDGHRLPINGQPLVDVFNLVARQTDNTLDVVNFFIRGITEDNHIASFRLTDRNNLGVQHRQTQTVVIFVH